MSTPTLNITTLTSPINITTTKTINGFLINSVNVNPFTSASVVISLYDSSNNFIKNSTINLTGTDYTSWGNNDQYLISFIEGKIPSIVL